MNDASPSGIKLVSADSTPLEDYAMAYYSRQLSVQARREVADGRAGMAILGEGKEVAQVVMAKVFQKGDWRSGYYRDQTFMLATGGISDDQFFAQLYADTDPQREGCGGARQALCHYASRFYDGGQWLDQTKLVNVASDISCTAGQMPRLIGLGMSSKLYREAAAKGLDWGKNFSRAGNEVAFGTIGDASTSEGHFWETINAMGVMQIPVAVSIWDNGYGISVPRHLQTIKGSMSEVLPGFANSGDLKGIAFYSVRGWDYQELVDTYQKAIQRCRNEHNPCVIHVKELTQPLGHSSSGNHKLYKDADRLEFEKDYDCLTRMRAWLIQSTSASEAEVAEVESAMKQKAWESKNRSFKAWQEPFQQRFDQLLLYKEPLTRELSQHNNDHSALQNLLNSMESQAELKFASLDHPDVDDSGDSNESSEGDSTAMAYVTDSDGGIGKCYTARSSHYLLRRILYYLENHDSKVSCLSELKALEKQWSDWGEERFERHLQVSSKDHSPLYVKSIPPVYSDSSEMLEGAQIIASYFDRKMAQDHRVIIMGEDVGHLGGVNLEFQGLYQKYGSSRMIDTGIRELTILGQGHGAAMRGFRPVVDIQYLDYLAYCIQGMTDDLAGIHWRTNGGQVSPTIVRTKGHRLMGIWHAGSPMGMYLSACRGMHICTPRNMVQAAGLYQTLLAGDDPALVVEPLNGYKNLEKKPDNLGEYNLPLGQVEILKPGDDVTLVTYGSCCPIAVQAAELLEKDFGVSVEVIDCQTLMPFDRAGDVGKSVQKTGALLVMDEDVPGSASAYLLREIQEKQGAYDHFAVPPRTLTAVANRCAFSTDGDYYCKPQVEDVMDRVFEICAEKKAKKGSVGSQ